MSNYRKQISSAYVQCDPFESLKFDDPRWVELDKDGVRGNYSCTEMILNTLELMTEQERYAHLLFSGFPGSGKSTLLLRLVGELRNLGHDVIYVDVEEYLNLNIPIETYEILLAIAGEMDKQFPRTSQQSLWDSISGFLNREVSASADIKFAIPGGSEMRMELRENVDFRRSVKELINKRQKHPAIIEQCRQFIDKTVAEHQSAKPIVVVLDNLERNRGRQHQEIRDSLHASFNLYAKDLHLPCHTVYSIPPWLRFTSDATSMVSKFDKDFILPMCKVIDQKSGDRYQKGIDLLVEIAAKRFDVEQVFGDTNPGFLRNLGYLSGGYIRDYLRLVRGVLLKIYTLKFDGPPSKEELQRFADEESVALADDYGPSISLSDMPILLEVQAKKDVPKELNDIEKLIDWLDNHFIICYQNGGEWYDIHPLLAEKSNRFKRLAQEIEQQDVDPTP